MVSVRNMDLGVLKQDGEPPGSAAEGRDWIKHRPNIGAFPVPIKPALPRSVAFGLGRRVDPTWLFLVS